MNFELNKIYCGDCLDVLQTLPDESVQCCITSPPYYGLRDYGTATWIGGHENCEHTIKRDKYNEIDLNGYGEHSKDSMAGIDYCKLCGAKRIDSQIGLEKTPELYVEKLVEIFHEVKRVLRKDGTLWLNLGDSYCNAQYGSRGIKQTIAKDVNGTPIESRIELRHNIIKDKDLIGIPWAVAFALRADGWWLRQDIIWHKPNPMPESVKDRCTKSHEYIFLLSKSGNTLLWNNRKTNEFVYQKPKYYGELDKDYYINDENKKVSYWIGKDYYYDYEAIQEEATGYDGRKDTLFKGGIKYNDEKFQDSHIQSFIKNEHERWKYKNLQDNGLSNHSMHEKRAMGYKDELTAIRNKRSVWTVCTQPYAEAHFATFPPSLIINMIKAGTKAGDLILDPFSGSGTTAMMARKLDRNYIGIDLNPEYVKMSEERIFEVENNLFSIDNLNNNF